MKIGLIDNKNNEREDPFPLWKYNVILYEHS